MGIKGTQRKTFSFYDRHITNPTNIFSFRGIVEGKKKKKIITGMGQRKKKKKMKIFPGIRGEKKKAMF